MLLINHIIQKKSRNSDDNVNQKMTVIEIDPPPIHH